MAIAAGEVPFLDLSISTRQVEDDVLGDVRALLATSAFVNGPAVAEFETEFAGYCGAVACVAVASGLDALRLGLASLDLDQDAEIIVPALTFVATWEAVTQAGGIPIPVDVTDADYNLDVAAADATSSSRTAAVMPVHLYGQMADMSGLVQLAERRGIALLEDAAQAHGATRDGYRAGANGTASGFSFYPGKNLGAFGDAGALTTDDPGIAARVQSLREHGQTRKYHHDEVGWTARMDTIQAAVLLRKLPYLDSWNDQRRKLAALYTDALTGLGDLRLPPVPRGSSPVWHVFVVRTADPTGLANALRNRGIGTGRHYPEPPHLSGAYASLGYAKGSFPVAEAIARECLSLPIFPGMTESQLERVVEAVASWFTGG